MNRVILLGNLGNDAELKALGNGNSVLNFSLATSEKWKDKDTGEQKEKTQWHRCALFGKRAESLASYLVKGTRLVVEGSIEYRSYEKDGVKQYATNINVSNVEFAGGGKSNGGGEKRGTADDYHPADNSSTAPVGDDDIPF